jgi:hypothetical protein
VLGPVRTLVSLGFVGLCVWASFHVSLGGRTFAEHMDRIGRTPEAQELVDGTRATVQPVLQDAADRVLGERVEAPTADAPPAAATKLPPAPAPAQAQAATPRRPTGPESARVPAAR